MSELSIYLNQQFRRFDRTALWSWQILWDSLINAGWWIFSACCFVLIVHQYPSHLPVEYLLKAIAEGNSPRLWNVIGTIGWILFGLVLLFPGWHFIARGAHEVLKNTYAIGVLGVGILTGQLILALLHSNFSLLKTGLLGLGGGFSLGCIFILNFILCYLAHLAFGSSISQHFLSRLKELDFRIRIPSALIMIGLPIALLMLEH